MCVCVCVCVCVCTIAVAVMLYGICCYKRITLSRYLVCRNFSIEKMRNNSDVGALFKSGCCNWLLTFMLYTQQD